MNLNDLDTAAAKVAGQLSADPMDTAARDVVTQQRQAAKISLYNSLMQDPDMVARSRTLGRQTGLPTDLVQRNFKEVERGVYLNNVDSLLERNPAVTQFLASPEFAALAHDDVDQLGAMETTLRGFKRTGGAAMSGLWSLASGLTGIARAPFDIAAPILDPISGSASSFPLLPVNPLRSTAQGLGEVQRFLSGQAQANMPRAEGVVSGGIYSGVASLSRNLALMPLALVNPPLGLTLMAGSVAGDEYGQAREQGLEPVTALSYGVTQGAIEYATERLPLLKLVGDLKVGAPLYRVVQNQLATEIPGEQLATVLQDLNSWAALPENRDKPFKDYLAERPSAAAQTLIATIVGVGGQVTIAKSIDALLQMNQGGEQDLGEQAAARTAEVIAQAALKRQYQLGQVEMAERDAQALTQLTELVQNSKLAQRDPQAFQQFVEQVVQDGPVQDVYVSAQVFLQTAQAAGVTEQQLPESVRDQLGEALVRGGDIRIPIQEFASQVAPAEYAQGLIDHLKTDPMGMSRAEAQVYMQTQVEEMQAEVERELAQRDEDLEFRAGIDAVKAEFKAQLDAANRFTAEVNESYSNLLANFYAVTAAKVGMTPEQLMQRYPLRIQAEGVAGGQTFEQGGNIEEVRSAWAASGVDGNIAENNGTITLSKIVVPESERSSGKGSAAMQALVDYADRTGQRVALSPSTDFGGTSKARLTKFYKRFGFVENKGRNKDFRISEAMYRDPAASFNQSDLFAGQLPATVDINGVQRPTTNSNGQPIAQTEQGVRNFWRWFGDSKVVDAEGRPLVVYHGTTSDIEQFDASRLGENTGAESAGMGFFFTDDIKTAESYGNYAATDARVAALLREAEAAEKRGDWDAYDAKVVEYENLDASFSDPQNRMAGQNVLPVYLRAENPLRVDAAGENAVGFDIPAAIKKAVRAKNDGIIMQNLDDAAGLANQPATHFVAFDPTQIKSAIGNDGTFDPQNPNILRQSAFHGSPHRFSKFSLDAIGTGEGAQAYGWGLYFASKREVAEYYRDALAAVDTTLVVAGKRYRAGDTSTPEAEAAAFVIEISGRNNPYSRRAGETMTATKAIREAIAGVSINTFTNDADAVREALLKMQSEGVRFVAGGPKPALYQVDIPESSELLDWDKPLSEQPEGVLQKLEAAGLIDNEVFFTVEGAKPLTDATGQDLYDLLSTQWREGELDVEADNGPQAASIYLGQIGIPGLQYLDGTSRNPFPFEVQIFSAAGTLLKWEKLRSRADADAMVEAAKADGNDAKVIERGAGEGHHNFVVWDENRVTVEAVNDQLAQAYEQRTGITRGQIAFGNDITQVESIITLLKDADLSTFLHEAGHFFLEVQFDLANRTMAEGAGTPEQQQFLADTQTLLKWFGVDSIETWYSLTLDEKRSYHETFARGFEAYLFEGKAPSIELQGLFQRFRAWLIRVYRDLKNLNVTLTDEVRGVMDRMIATTEQIELAQKGRSMMPLFTSPQQAGATVEEFKAYQELGTEATATAIEDLQARTLRDMQWLRNARGREIKRLQKESAARRREMRVEARSEILSQPVYQAWQFLTNKMDANDKAAMVTPEPRKSKPGPVEPEVDSLFVAIAKLGGLDRAEVEADGWFDPKERSPMPIFGKYLLRRQGGKSFDAMAEALGELGYLPLDQNGKVDVRDLEERFGEEYRGNPQFSTSKDYSDVQRGDAPAGAVADTNNMGAGRLDRVGVRDLVLPEEVLQILDNHKMLAKDGLNPDFVAEQFGFSSGDELVRALVNAESPDDAIEGLTDQKMLERYGELATPEAIERAADAAIHNDARARFVATELNMAQRAIGKPKVLAAAAREYARAMIDRLLVRNVKPSQYAAAEVRAAKAAEKAMKAGDMATVAAEKRNQLINTYATKSAHDAITEVEKGLRYLKKFETDGTRKAIDVDYLDQIDAILERFDLRTGQSLKSIDKRKSLAKWIGEQEDLGIEVDLPEKLTSEAFRQSYKDMTVEEFRGLVDGVKQIEHLGRLKERLLTAQDNRRFADVVETLTASIEEHAGDRKANNRTRDTLANRALRLFTGFVASHRKVASLARQLDGFADAGPMWTYLIQSMNERGDMEATMRADATARLATLLKPVLAAGKMGGKGQFFPSLGISLNRGEQFVLALNTGNAGNLQRLTDGMGWTTEQIQPVLQNLTAADWQAVQAVWDFFESYRPQIAAKERRVMGREPQWVEPAARRVQTRDGQQLELRGGYFPIVYDPRTSARAEQQADAEEARRMLKGAMVAATTRRTFTKTRAEEVSGRPLLLTFDGLFRGVNDVIHDLAWHEWVIDANRILRNDKVDRAIRSTYGADTVQQFKSAIRDIAGGDAPQVDALSRALTPLRAGAAVAGLGLNIMNALIQPVGITQSMVRIGSKWVGMGIAELATSPRQLAANVMERSEFMRNRARTMNRELNEIRSIVQGKGEMRQKLDAMMFLPMTSVQLMVDLPTWWGAYQKALADAPVDMAEDVAEDKAVRLADQAVRDSQGGGQVSDLSAIQRGGPLQKLFTVFYGFFNTAYNLGAESYGRTNFRDPLSVMHLGWDFLLLFTIPALLTMLIKDALQPGGDDEDPEELARRLAGEQISFLMGTMVGLREATGAIQYMTGTRQFDMAYGGPAGLRFFQELDKFGKQVGQGELDRALVRSGINVGGVFLQLPSGQLNRTIDGVIAISEGKTENPAALLFGVDQDLK